MDKIELRVVEHDGVPVDRHWYALFGIAGGTIGRSSQNKLIISDSDSSVARVHGMVRLDAGGAFVANLSERDTIWVADQPVHSGQEVPLPIGTHLRIGAYTLAAVTPGTPFEPRPSVAPATQHETSSQPAAFPADDPQATAPVTMPNNPWAALPTSNPDASHDPATLSGESAVAPLETMAPLQTAAPEHRPLLIPNDFDPFAAPPKQSPQPLDSWNAGLPPQGADDLIEQRHDGMVNALPLKDLNAAPLDDASFTGLPSCFEDSQKLDPLALFGQGEHPADADSIFQTPGRSTELGQAFNLPRMQADAQPVAPDAIQPAAAPKSGVAPVAAALAAVSPGAVATPPSLGGLLPTDGLNLDIFELVSGAAATPVTPNADILGQNQTVAVADASDAHSALTPPAAPAQPTDNATLKTLALAFTEGAGLDPGKISFDITAEFMRTLGEVLRIAVQGTMDLLGARSSIKHEFRAGVTIIATGANNPLKFLPNSEGVIMQMIGQTFPGFMKPLPAMRDAYQDLHIHQVALMAGIRAAYVDALTRFDPNEMERQTASRTGLLDKLLTNARKAALWDNYKRNFDVLRRNAEDDLMAFSGRTFVEAYENAEQSAKGDRP